MGGAAPDHGAAPGAVIVSITDIICGLGAPATVIVMAPVYTPGGICRGFAMTDKLEGVTPEACSGEGGEGGDARISQGTLGAATQDSTPPPV
jgi:hypothetical protein